MPNRHHSKVLIIGAGPAGYAAAIYAARGNLQPILVTGLQPGGQMTITTDVENYPGFADIIQGPWLMEQMRQQAEHVGTRMILDLIVAIDLARRPFVATGDSGDIYTGDTVIIATGAQARWLGLPSEEVFRGFGVSACATCDGFFFRGKDVVVVGGGDTAVEEILGVPEPPVVTGIRLRNLRTGALTKQPCNGVFIAIGHTPVTGFVAGQLPLDPEGYVRARPDSTETAIPGVFAAGDVRDKIFRQAVTAAGMGCMAALEAEKFLAAQEESVSVRAAK